MGEVLLMLCYVMLYVMCLVKCRRRYSSQNGLGLGGPALWVRARVVHPQVCPFGPQIGHADKPCPCTHANRKKYPPSKVLVAETSAQCSARLIVHVRACVCVRMCMLASSRECVRACVSSCVSA